MRATVLRGALVAQLLLAACSSPEGPERTGIPRDLEIFVEIDGSPLPTIDAGALAVAPDIEDEHRMAWKLERLVPQLAQATQLVVEKRDRQRIVLPLGQQAASASQIALVLNRKGEVVLAALDPQNPFPAFHGRGGNRGRAPGEERIHDPYWLRLRSRPSERRDEQSERE